MNLALPEMVVLNGTVFELDKFKKEYHAVNYIMPYSEFEKNQDASDVIYRVNREETEKMEAIAKINKIANDNYTYYINYVINYIYEKRPWIWAAYYGKDEWFKLVKKEACAIQGIEFSVRNDYDDSEGKEINEKELNDLVNKKIYKYLDRKLPKSPTIYRRLRINHPIETSYYDDCLRDVEADNSYDCKVQPELYVISLIDLLNEGDVDTIVERDADYFDMMHGYDRPDTYLENLCDEINMDYDYDEKYDDRKYLF